MKGTELEQIIIKMCEYVGADYSSLDLTQPNWYWQHTWTQEMQNKFVDWLTVELYNNTQARQELMKYPRRKLYECQQVAEQFVFVYGWKLSDG